MSKKSNTSARLGVKLKSECRRGAFVVLWLWVLGSGLALPAAAYVGPGAGIALASSFLVVFTTLILAVLAVLSWPVRKLWRLLHRKEKGKPHIKRLIVVGLDGQDPRLTDRFMGEGKMPNFQKLAKQGCYLPLRTTFPSVSPVAWSSFSTGTHPSKHNIFDFLDRDRRTYLPVLSSAHIGDVDRYLKLGKYQIPLGKPDLRLLRKSKPFWTLLGENFIWSTVLRVPITFPPDKFYGAQLSAMCVPDLLGTQGTFLYYTTRPSEGEFKEGGERCALSGQNGHFETTIKGPVNSMLTADPPRHLELPMTIDVDRKARRARVTIDGEIMELERRKLTDWVTLTFKAAPGVKVTGICRLMITEMEEHVSLYITPISLDPENPAMPVSHPSYYSTYLAKKIGPYSTLGLAEDTWALNEEITDDATFLQQTYDVDAEREAMFFAAMQKLKQGALVCVWDATDRIQHMFWRYLEEGHPAAKGKENAEHKNAIEELYKHNDAMVGRVMKRLRKGDVMMVLSDHGFTSFRRGVNLNAWLLQNGYLKLEEGKDGSSEWLRDIDWSQTKAYALGLTGMFLNLEGREAQGIVKPGEEAEALKAELIEKISGLRDEEKDEIGINELFDTHKLYQGPYVGNAPDFLVGYNHGYRVSWDCATGMISGPVFEDNIKAWSGDHGVDPRIVPGVFFCTHKVDTEDPALMDVAPTAMRLFGLKIPPHMEGKTLYDDESLGSGRLSDLPAETTNG